MVTQTKCKLSVQVSIFPETDDKYGTLVANWQKSHNTVLYYSRNTHKFTAQVIRNNQLHTIKETTNGFKNIRNISQALYNLREDEQRTYFNGTFPVINKTDTSYTIDIFDKGRGGTSSSNVALMLTLGLTSYYTYRYYFPTNLEIAFYRKPNEANRVWENRIQAGILAEMPASSRSHITMNVNIQQNDALSIHLLPGWRDYVTGIMLNAFRGALRAETPSYELNIANARAILQQRNLIIHRVSRGTITLRSPIWIELRDTNNILIAHAAGRSIRELVFALVSGMGIGAGGQIIRAAIEVLFRS